jgi:cell division protein FtsX
MDAKKPQVGKVDVTVTVVNRLLTYLRPVVIVGTVLVLCLAVYAMALILNKR